MAEMTEKQWLSGVQSSIIKELTTHKAALPAGFNKERFALNTVTVISEMLKDKGKKAKLVYDALNGVAWHDDNAIVDTQVRKFYSDIPRVEVFIRVVE